MSKSNENQPISVAVYLGGITTNNQLVPAIYLPKKSRIVSVHLINGANIAASDSHFCAIALKNGSTVVAELDTRAAHENGIALNTAEALNIVSGQEDQAAAAVLTVLYTETGTVTLTDAQLVITYFPY